MHLCIWANAYLHTGQSMALRGRSPPGHLTSSPSDSEIDGHLTSAGPVGKDQSYQVQSGVGRRHHLLAHARGFLYLVAWRMSNTLEADFCVDAMREALGQGQPEVFNTDQSLPQ